MPNMKFHFRLLSLLLLILTLFSSVAAQAPHLTLDRQGVYLSGITEPPEGLSNYRQRYNVVTERTEGEQTQQSSHEWINELAASGDRHSRLTSTGLMNSVSAQYLVDGQAFFYGEFNGEASCMAGDDFVPVDPGVTVSNVTGFREATLVGEGETINGILTDRYRLEPPAFNNYYDPASLQGELWMAREGSLIVRYKITGKSSTTSVAWNYDLEAVNALDTIELPEVCTLAE